jgi:ADP-ribose pyrophosphatase YjhB (NUDIX family)
MKYCPFCRSPLKNSVNHQKSCTKCAYTYYNNPRSTASIIIQNNDKILMAKRAWHPFKGYWDLIGGFVDYYETPEEAVIREVKEETGLIINDPKLIRIAKGIYTDYDTKQKLSVIDHQFILKDFTGNPIATDDVAEIKWFSKQDLPPMKKIAAFENIRSLIELFKTSRL